MKGEKLFITDEQRNELYKALNLVQDVYKNITPIYEDYTIIETSIYYIQRAISYEKKYY